MTVTSIKGAWKTRFSSLAMSTTQSAANGRDTPVYHSTADGVNAWISDLSNCLEVNCRAERA